MSALHTIAELEARIARCETVIRELGTLHGQLQELGAPADGSAELNRSLVSVLQRQLDYYRAALAASRGKLQLDVPRCPENPPGPAGGQPAS